MLRLLAYLLGKGVVTNKNIPEFLDENLLGLPVVTTSSCEAECNACIETCPTDAIIPSGNSVVIDRGACIACGQCVALCPSRTIENDLSVSTFAYDRQNLKISSESTKAQSKNETSIFQQSLAIRVVSTGCSACDLEISAANNPIFDMERFGISVVASPRFADALLITGPVPKAMHEALLSCYQAMAYPKLVIACGTCAISGGVHKNAYTQADGVASLLPVDVFIPGCPPHPWQVLRGILAAQKLKGKPRESATFALGG
jgi:Ni,Fe-hydrogenase III small subunit/NAD-dependent dihydropyrimidine dehydrogenase PreA subunit